jgi:hypothetical protein
MAPEQTRHNGRGIGPAADVYSLGAILYELLTGRPPFLGVGVLETLEQVRTLDPVPPSRLLSGLPRDLETVCLKCLRKEPTQRYPSALELADDLGRFARGEPVRARPAPMWEKAWKWVRRRPATAAVLVALASSVVVALAALTVLWRQETQALDRERRQKDELEAAYAANLLTLAERDWTADSLDSARRHLDACPPGRRGPEWQRLHRLCHACQLTLGDENLARAVTAVAWSRDGRHLASNISAKGVELWDPETGKRRFVLEGHGNRVSRLAFDPEDRVVSLSLPPAAIGLRIASTRLEIRTWEPVHGQPIRNRSISAAMTTCALSGDGQRLALSRYGALHIVDLTGDGGPIAVATNSTPSQSPALNRDGRFLAAYTGKVISVWEVSTGAVISTIPVSPAAQRLLLSDDGSRLAAAIPDRHQPRVEVWDVRSGSSIARLVDPPAAISALAFSPDSRRLAAGNNDRTILIWDLETKSVSLTLRGHRGRVMSLAFSPDGRRLASGGGDGTVRIWDVRPANLLAE